MGHLHTHDTGAKKLSAAIIVNILLTIVQLVAGIFSGSLSLIADALHNFSDAGSLLIALFARKIGMKPADRSLTYGYKRAEILGALINSSTLILIGLYLCYKAITKYFSPEPIDGWIVVWIAGFALVIDVITAILTYRAGANKNINIRAAFIHNLSDALASIVVILAGTLIILFKVYYVDLIATILISIYIIIHGYSLMMQSIRILMQAVPREIDMKIITQNLLKFDGVKNASHIHLWQLDDKKMFFEGQLVVDKNLSGANLLKEIKHFLASKYKINHSTIEIVESV